jgi:hypothetical protein
MSYKSTSIKEVLMRVIRNLDHKIPSRYVDSMLEWIPEAIEELRTPFTLDTKSTPNLNKDGALWSKNHVIKLPCGLVEVLAVEDQFGYRIHRTGQQMDIEDMSPARTQLNPSNDDARVTDFYTDVLPPAVPGVTIGNQPAIPWTGTNIKLNTSSVTAAFYDLKMDYLQTSEECMFVKIHYKAMPVDKEGYPLVPDITEYKEALYWYVMKKLIAAGYQHPVLPSSMEGIEYCEKKYETYSGRALGEIKMPDQDRIWKLWASTTRLIPPVNFHEDFFSGSEQIQTVKYV